MQIQINPLHLTLCVMHAEGMAKRGLPLTRIAPTLRETREVYALDAYARQIDAPAPTTWAKAAPLLRSIKTMIDEQVRELRPEAMR